MPKSSPTNNHNAHLARFALWQISTAVYLAMSVLGLLVIHFSHDSIRNLFRIPSTPDVLIHYLTVAGLAVIVLLAASYTLEEYFPGYRLLKAAFMHILGPSHFILVIYLSAISALGEEILFRGAVQPFAGLPLTAILFGLLHLGPDGRISTWSVWAAFSGLIIGWVFMSEQNLWPAIAIHFTVNFFSIMSLRRAYKRHLELAARRTQSQI